MSEKSPLKALKKIDKEPVNKMPSEPKIKSIAPPYTVALTTLKGKNYNMADGSVCNVKEIMLEALTEASPFADASPNNAMVCFNLAKKVMNHLSFTPEEMTVISNCVFARFKQPGLLGAYVDAVNTNSAYSYHGESSPEVKEANAE